MQSPIPWNMCLGSDGEDGIPYFLRFFSLIKFYHRRSCPGIWFADAAIYISSAILLAAFNVSKAIDPDTGEPIMPEYKPQTGTVRYEKPSPTVHL